MIDPNSSRTLWQKNTIDVKWVENKAKGYIEAATGVGKTYLGVLAIKLCNSRHPDKTVNVIVPTTKLKEDWTGYLVKNGKKKTWVKGHIELHNLFNVNVYVVNTYVREQHECGLLICDEAHRYSNDKSDLFKTVIDRTKFHWILCLSATLESHHKSFLHSRGITSCGKVTAKEAMDNGWISKYEIYCIPVELGEEDRMYYDKLHSEFNRHFAMFNFNFELAMRCVINMDARRELARDLGWELERVNACTFNWNRNMRKRKEFLYHIESKIDEAIRIANELKMQTILFGQSVEGANRINETLGDECVVYHSKLKASEKKSSIKKLTDGRTKVKYISSCKALEEGFNVEGLEIGICWSRTSKSLRAVQTLGRICRFVEGKTAYFFELYVPDTQDERWLKSSLKGQSNVYWVQSADQVIELIKNK
jgi:superfamily II DNA or RNA helicase